MTTGRQLPHHDFAVDKIFGATETYETDFQKGGPALILAGRSPEFRLREQPSGFPGVPECGRVEKVEEKVEIPDPPSGRPWLECAGELAHLHDETVRIQALIDGEFEQIEAEDQQSGRLRLFGAIGRVS
jgi:hypothetical protein